VLFHVPRKGFLAGLPFIFGLAFDDSPEIIEWKFGIDRDKLLASLITASTLSPLENWC